MNVPTATFRSRKPAKRMRLTVEPLDDRCTPAAVFVTYNDVDGDLVKITASKPGLVAPPLDPGDLTISGTGQLETLNFTDPGFDGSRITIQAMKKPGGDGLANVGFINAQLVDLDRVVVSGDLGKIAVGDAMATDPGLNLLKVRSLGTLGLTTGAPDLGSVVRGKLGTLQVKHDVVDASVTVIGSSNGQIGTVFIGGDLTGGASLESGRILTDGSIGKVRIHGDLNGGGGASSGQIYSLGSIASVQIGGDVVGYSGDDSGHIHSNGSIGVIRIGGNLLGSSGERSGEIRTAGDLGFVRIGGHMKGSSGPFSGLIGSSGDLGKVIIRGDMTGGSGMRTGLIGSAGAIGEVRIGRDLVGHSGHGSAEILALGDIGFVGIGRDLVGGSISGAASLTGSGGIRSLARIGAVRIGGSLIAGADTSTGALEQSGVIAATDDIGSIRIGRDLLGNETNPTLIVARGQKVKPATGFDIAIGSLSVGRNVVFARVLAGFNLLMSPTNADASVGKVLVGRDWIASSVVAGVENLGLNDMVGGMGADADNLNFADGHDVAQVVDDTSLVSRIGRIAIGGKVEGTSAAGDHFGFVAQQIGSLKIGAKSFALTTGPGIDLIGLATTSDVHLLEVV